MRAYSVEHVGTGGMVFGVWYTYRTACVIEWLLRRFGMDVEVRAAPWVRS